MKNTSILIAFLLCSSVVHRQGLAQDSSAPRDLTGQTRVIGLKLYDLDNISTWGFSSRLEIKDLEGILNPVLNNIQSKQEVYAWESFSVRDRIPHYCIDEAACLATRLGASLKQVGVPFAVIQVRAGSDYAVRALNYRYELKTFSYHQALLVSINGAWMVVDPVLTGHITPIWLDYWVSRFELGRSKKVDLFVNGWSK